MGLDLFKNINMITSYRWFLIESSQTSAEGIKNVFDTYNDFILVGEPIFCYDLAKVLDIFIL